MVEIYDENYKDYPNGSEVIANVEYNEILDYLVNTNYQNGGTGRHLGFGQLKNGDYYLIFGTNWQGEKNYGYRVPSESIVKEAIKSDNIDKLKDFPELLEIYESKYDDKRRFQTSKTFSIRVNLKENQKEIDKKISEMKERIQKFTNLE